METRTRATWAMRGFVASTGLVQALGGFGAGARTAAIGLALSMLPTVLGALAGRRPPGIAETPYVLAVSLVSTSKAFNMPDRIRYWDKLVHFVEMLLCAWIVTVFLRGYRDTCNPRVPSRLTHGFAVLSGVGVGTAWEVVEYVIDRFIRQNLVKSTLGTLLDLVVDTLGAVAGTVLAGRAYDRFADQEQRATLGRVAGSLLGDPPEPTTSDG